MGCLGSFQSRRLGKVWVAFEKRPVGPAFRADGLLQEALI